REVYDIIHPLQQLEQPRPLRTSPFYARLQALGAVFFEGRGWERPQWYEANEALASGADAPPPLPRPQGSAGDWERGQGGEGLRTGWAAQHWSPISAKEHLATRARVAMFDMTPLARCEVAGSAALAFLQGLTTNNLDRPLGSVTYTAMTNARGGVLSDITVTRLHDERFWVAHNGPNDLAYFQQQRRQHVGAINVRDVTGGTCCVGVWGPLARQLVQPLSDDSLDNEAFPYLSAQQIHVGEVPVLALRVSYVGELGWELYTSSEYGLRLWDLLWQAGQPLGVIAAGRGAFDSLRLEKGYRFYGVDIHSGYDPYEAGIGFTVKLNKGPFRGSDALAERKARGPQRKLCCLVLDDPRVAVLGNEPIFAGDAAVGYVTSANFGYSVGHSIAYGYLPVDHAHEGARVEIAYFGVRHGATVAREPLFDPKGERLRT
ncbi:MAG: sarcosine dehydrogenase, partial [Chloroflexales bacterium]|nr:sarcosine dehydrogenase [Chloroflexales bacterium]